MPSPLIAIVGDANKSRDPVLAKRAAEDLGVELAQRGCRILVFSSEPDMIEYQVVHGYLGTRAKKLPHSIQVRYPPKLYQLFPGEKPDNDVFDRQPQGDEWEVSFYPWLSSVDGIILIGGGYTTKVAGLIAIGSKTPIITLAGFGGAAENILQYLWQERHSIATEADLNVMAQQGWGSTSAARCIDALLSQMERRRALDQTLDRVFPRLLKIEVPVDAASLRVNDGTKKRAIS